MSGLVKKKMMKWETRCYIAPLFSFGQRSLTCASSHINVMHLKVISKKIWVSRIFWLTKKGSNLVNSLLITYGTSVNMWDIMASLQWWFHQQQSDWLEFSEWLTCRNCELSLFYRSITFDELLSEIENVLQKRRV